MSAKRHLRRLPRSRVDFDQALDRDVVGRGHCAEGRIAAGACRRTKSAFGALQLRPDIQPLDLSDTNRSSIRIALAMHGFLILVSDLELFDRLVPHSMVWSRAPRRNQGCRDRHWCAKQCWGEGVRAPAVSRGASTKSSPSVKKPLRTLRRSVSSVSPLTSGPSSGDGHPPSRRLRHSPQRRWRPGAPAPQ